MKLSFTLLVIDQFKSFIGAAHELDLGSYEPGLHFVRGKNLIEPRLGSNGAAKSSLFDAICWCLYGKTVAGLRNPDIQARFGKKATSVALNFKTDKQPQEIKRTTHPNRLLINDKEVGQEQVDTLIGLDYDTFTNTVLLGQGRPLFFDLAPKAKLDLFGTVLNLDRWEARAGAANDAAAALEKEEAQLASDLNSLEGQQVQVASLLEQALISWRGWRDEQATIEANTQARITELKAEREKKEQERAGHDLIYDGAATELKAAQENSRKLAAENEQLVLERSTFSGQIASYRTREADLTEELAVLGTTDACPVCGQSIKGTDLNHHKAELQRKLKECSGKKQRLETSHTALTAKITTLQTRLNNSRAAERTFQTKAETARNAMDRLTPVVERLKAEVEQLAAGLKTQRKAANPYTEQVTELRTNKKTLEGEASGLTKKLQKQREQIEHTRFWVKGFKEVKLYELEDVLQELELATNAALAEVGLVDWQIQYTVEKETKAGTIQRGLNVFILSPKDKAPVRWECWSGGEGQRLRLVGALALSEVLLTRAGVEPGLEILDEPTQHLSGEGIRDLCEFLAERARTLGRVCFYVDHQSVESVRFNSVLTVIKDKDGSYLESELSED